MLQGLIRRYLGSLAKPWSYEQAQQWTTKLTRDTIPKDHIRSSFSKSSGPGGQNVNKVNTKVELRMDLYSAKWIPDYAREKLRSKATRRGELVVTSDRSRSQTKNMDDCYDKLLDMITAAVAVPREPSAATLAKIESIQRQEERHRKERKQRQSTKKAGRRAKGEDI